MNVDQLLRGFDLLGDSPDTVQQLRKLVVGLAIAGRLDPIGTDKVTSAFLVEASGGQKAAVKNSSQRNTSPSNVTLDDLPAGFRNPEAFVRLGSVARIEKGLTGIMKAAPGPYPLVVTASHRIPCDHYDFDGAAAIIPLVSSAGHGKASLQRLQYQEGKFALGSILAAVFPHQPDLVSPRFIFEYLTAFKDELLVSRMIGTANVSLSVGKVSEVPIPLVAPAVQRKVDELMALCDRLEAARADRESRRNRLTASTFVRLNTPDPDSFRDDTRFALDVLPALTTRPDQLQHFRQLILNLAMRGKLIAQQDSDVPASELLRKKVPLPASYTRRKKLVKETPVSLPDSLFPPVPDTWNYVAINTLYDLNIIVDYADGNHGSLYPRTTEFGDIGVVFVSAKDLNSGRVNWSSCSKLNESWARKLTKGWAEGGDVLLTHNATVGRVAFVEPEIGRFLLGTSVTFYRVNNNILDARFLSYVMQSGLWQGQLNSIMAQTTRNQVSIQKQAFFRIVLAPIAEQRRLVVKLDELMSLCDRLEASLIAGEKRRSGLLTAILGEALRPAEERDEAA